MAAGDFVVRRNASNTDTIPNAGSDLLTLWDTAVANEGAGITYSAGTFTLGETGKFLVLCSDFGESLATQNDERLNWKMTLNLAGSELLEGYSTGFIRKTFDEAEQAIPFTAAVIDVATITGTGDDLQVRLERIDDTTAGGQEPDRVGGDRSGITILKLDDTWNYGLYRSTSAFTSPTSDNTPATVPIGTTDQEDSPFTRTTNTVDIATNNLVLAIWSLKSEDATPAGRAEYHGRLTLAGSEVPGSRSQTYLRVVDNCDWAGMSCVTLLEPTSGQDLELEIIAYEDGGDEFEATLQLIELPSGAEAAIMEATTGDFNTAATNFTWDTLPHIDTAAFTATAGNANIDVDNADDYLTFGSQALTTLGLTGTRHVPALQFRVNTTDDETAGHSAYSRGSGTAETPAIATGTLLTGLAANDSVYVRNDRLSTETTAVACDVGAFSLIRLSSLFAAGTSHTATATDAIGVSDQVASAKTTPATITDPIGIADQVSAAKSVPVTVTDPVGVTDGVATGKVIKVTITDSVGVTDNTANVKTIIQVVTDPVGVTDQVTGAKASAVTVTDAIGVTDATSRVADAKRTVTDPVGISDAVAVTKTIPVTITDPVGVTDQTSRVHDAKRTVTDDAGVTDDTAPVKSIPVTATEAVGVTDQVAAVKTIPVTIIEAVGVADATDAASAKTTTVTDDIGATDSVTRVVDATRIVTDNIGIADDVDDVKSGGLTVTVTDAVGVTDAVARSVNAERVATDAIGVTDQVVAGKDIAASVTDPVGVSDSVSGNKTISRTVTDPVGVTDSVTRVASYVRVIADTVGLTDGTQRAIGYVRTVTDPIGVTDTVTQTTSAEGFWQVDPVLSVPDSPASAADPVASVADPSASVGAPVAHTRLGPDS